MTEERPDPARVQEASGLLNGYLAGGYTTAMVHLGLNLGLYESLAGAGPLGSDDVARRTGLHERWVREWLWQQVAAGLLDLVDGSPETFELRAETAVVLLDESSPAFVPLVRSFPLGIELALRAEACFREGKGYTYDAGGERLAMQNDLNLGRLLRQTLVDVILPRLDGVLEQLSAGAKVADIGSGSGAAVIELATKFPASQVHGFEIATAMLTFARAAAARAGTPNSVFVDATADPLPGDGSYDFVITTDCLHDMDDPAAMARAIRAALRPGGVWLIGEIDARDTLRENLERHGPMVTAFLLSGSIRQCLPSSMTSAEAPGYGVFGLPESRLRAFVAEAGFSRFQRLDLAHPINAYFEVRP